MTRCEGEIHCSKNAKSVNSETAEAKAAFTTSVKTRKSCQSQSATISSCEYWHRSPRSHWPWRNFLHANRLRFLWNATHTRIPSCNTSTDHQRTVVRTRTNHFTFTQTQLRYVRVFAIANPSVSRLLSVTFVRPTQGLKRSTIFLHHFVP